MAKDFDRINGGFGGTPKFPPSMSLMFSLRNYKRRNSPATLQMVEFKPVKMTGGGMYDHLGGGLHRH